MEHGGQPQYRHVGYLAINFRNSYIACSYPNLHAAFKNLLEYRSNEKTLKIRLTSRRTNEQAPIFFGACVFLFHKNCLQLWAVFKIIVIKTLRFNIRTTFDEVKIASV